MRSLRSVLALSFFIASVTCALAQHQTVTDAESADLAGPVKSVSVAQTETDVQWHQPGGPTLVLPVWCMECEFDPDGNQTKSGQIINGSFQGQIIRIVHDANGLATDRFVEDASTGEAVRHEVVGPFGKTEQALYEGGKVHWRQTFSYDQYGNMIDWLTFDSTGKQEARVRTNKEPDGTLKQKSVWGKDGQLSYQQTFDPETEVEHFTTFDHFGRVGLTWTVVAGRLASFWEAGEAPDSPSQFGDNFTEDAGNDTSENYACHKDGRCDISRVHYEYFDQKRRNPLSAEWRDSEGNLRYAAYYEYEMDPFRNWTYRKVWVWSPALGERKLYETDSRTIVYWHN